MLKNELFIVAEYILLVFPYVCICMIGRQFEQRLTFVLHVISGSLEMCCNRCHI